MLTNLNDTLQILTLRLNHIRSMDSLLMKFYQLLHTIELDQNPLECDCQLDKTVQELQRSKIKITGQCQSLSEHRNINLIDLSNEQLPCHSMASSNNQISANIDLEVTTMPIPTTVVNV